MTDPKWCPECSEPWKRGRKSCDCGYRLQSVADDPRNDPHHGLCAFTYMGERCKLPGAIAETTRAERHTPFYCRFHMRCKDNPEEIEKVNRALATGEIGINKVDWRDELIAGLLANHPRKAA